MSRAPVIDTIHLALGQRVHDEVQARGAGPFARYAEGALSAARGIETVMGLLRHDQVVRESSDGEQVLSGYDIDGLLSLVQFAAFSLREDADRLQCWAEKHLLRGSQE